MGRKAKEQLPASGKQKLKKMEKMAGKGKGKLPAWLKKKEGPGDLTIGGAWGQLEGDGMQCLVKPLEKASTTSINLSCNNLGDEGMKFLCNALKTNDKVMHLNVSSNCIGDGGGLAFGSVLMKNRTLEEISLQGNQMTDKSLQAIALALRTRADKEQEAGCTKVDLSWNWIGHRGCHAYMKALEKCYIGSFPIGQSYARFVIHLGGQTNPTRENKDDRITGIGDEGCTYICQGLQKYAIPNVHDQLLLWHNDIGREGAKALAELMQNNTTVTDLNLCYNSLGGDGVETMASAMVSASPLRILNLSHNIITGGKGGCAIAELIKRGHTALTSINLAHNQLDDKAAKEIAGACAKSTTLKRLDISFNDKIGKDGAQAFGAMFAENQHMMTCSMLKMKWDVDTQDMVSDLAKKSPSTAFRTEDGKPDEKGRPQQLKVYCRTLVDGNLSDILVGGSGGGSGSPGRGSIADSASGGRRKSSAGRRRSKAPDSA